jgi:hypothetical protein
MFCGKVGKGKELFSKRGCPGPLLYLCQSLDPGLLLLAAGTRTKVQKRRL